MANHMGLIGLLSRFDRRGVAALEFALIAPVMIVLLAAAANIGLAVDHAINLSNAARAGAQYVIALPSDTVGARTAALGVLPGAVVTVGAMVCTCPAPGESTGGPTIACNTTTCLTGLTRTVTVTVTRAPVQIPGLAFNSTAASTRSVVARVQ